MKELDLLKKNWQNTNTFKQISEDEIYKMLHKKSSSIVKWILIVSILEFILLNGLGIMLTDSKIDRFMELHPYLNFLDKLNYIIIIGFIFVFYKNYQAISVLCSSKKLIERILKVRKTVNYYIIWNILIGSFFGAYGVVDGFNDVNSKTSTVNINQSSSLNLVSIIFSMIIIMAVIWAFYKLLYGNLLNRLSKNYNELKKIDL